MPLAELYVDVKHHRIDGGSKWCGVNSRRFLTVTLRFNSRGHPCGPARLLITTNQPVLDRPSTVHHFVHLTCELLCDESCSVTLGNLELGTWNLTTLHCAAHGHAELWRGEAQGTHARTHHWCRPVEGSTGSASGTMMSATLSARALRRVRGVLVAAFVCVSAIQTTVFVSRRAPHSTAN